MKNLISNVAKKKRNFRFRTADFFGVLLLCVGLSMTSFAQALKPYTVSVENATVYFDGHSHTLTKAVYDESLLRSGDRVKSVTIDSVSYIAAGTYKIAPTKVVIVDAGNHDVTDLYDLTLNPGNLTINHAEQKIKITATAKIESETVYNGLLQKLEGFDTLKFDVNNVIYTLSGVDAVASGTAVGVYTTEFSGDIVVKIGDVDVTEECEVTLIPGSMGIIPKPLNVFLDSTTVYNGENVIVAYEKFNPGTSGNAYVDGLVAGDYLIAGEVKTLGSDVGNYQYTSITETNTSELTQPFNTSNGIENYIVTISCNQKIIPFAVVDTVRGNRYSGVYDGQTHEASGYTLSSNDSSFDQTNVKFSGNSTKASRLLAGTTNMGLRSSQFYCSNANYDVTFYVIDGYVTIDKKDIGTIVTANASKKYDGSVLKNQTYTFDASSILPGDELKVEMEDSIIDAGRIPNTVKSYSIMRGTTDVTACYEEPVIKEGNLTIVPRNINVQTADTMKKYDGMPLTAPRYSISGDGFVGEEGMSLDFSKTSQTDVGVTYNVYEPVFFAGTNPDNYYITNDFGQLNVIGPFKANGWPQPVSCHGTASGWLYFFGTDGLRPYQYKVLGPGQTFESVEYKSMSRDDGEEWNLSPDVKYTLFMRDSLGDMDSTSFVLSDVAELVIDSIQVTGTTCNGSAGTAQAFVSGGTPVLNKSYFYSWSNGAKTALAKNLSYNQTYTVTVTDDNGCQATKSVVIPLSQVVEIQNFRAGTPCAKSVTDYVITPKNGLHGKVPSGLKYFWGNPEVYPANAKPNVIFENSSCSQDEASEMFHSGTVKNNSDENIDVVYTVSGLLDGCVIDDIFTVTLHLNGTAIPHAIMSLSRLESIEMCNEGGPLDLVANYEFRSETPNDYNIVWIFDQDTTRRVLSADEHRTSDTLHVQVPATDCQQFHKYFFSISDKSGCGYSDSSLVHVTRGQWVVDTTTVYATVACVEEAIAPHEIENATDDFKFSAVTDDCGNVVPWKMITYTIGQNHCDMLVYYDYIFKDCIGQSETKSYVYHVKDTIAPTLSKELTAPIKANVQDCIFYIPNLWDTIMPIANDNCFQRFLMGYEQIPESGSTITANTEVQIKVTDNCGNTAIFPINVTVNDSVKLQLDSVDSRCFNVSDGIILGSFSGGIPPYSVTWKSDIANAGAALDAPGSFTFENLPDGHYSIAVLSADGCHSKDTLQVDVEDRDEPLVITANSKTREYNGEPLTDDGYSYEGTLQAGDELSVTVEGSILNAGSVSNQITDVKILRDGIDVTCEYNLKKVPGTLTITRRPVKLVSADSTKSYDGTPLTNHTVTVASGSFVDGEGIASYDVWGTRTIVGTVENEFAYELISGTNPDNYNITRSFGTLIVTKSNKSITLSAKGDEKVYDGTPLTQPLYSYTGTIYEGDTLIAETEGSQTVVGKSYNVIKNYRIMHGTDTITDCYVMEPRQLGMLSVLPRSITLKAGSLSKEYDGEEHTWKEIPSNEQCTITVGELAEGHTLTADLKGARRAPGTTISYIDVPSIAILDAHGDTVTSNYKISTETGLIEIYGRNDHFKLTIVAASDSTDYTGAVQSLTGCDTIVVRGVAKRLPSAGLNHSTDLSFELINDNNNTVQYTVTDITAAQNQRNAGTYPMNFTGTPKVIDIDGNDVTSEFDVTLLSGKFIIRALPGLEITIKDTKPYDSTPLSSSYKKATAVGLGSADKLSAGTMVTVHPAIGTYTYGNTDPDWTSNIGTAFNTTGGISNYEHVTYIVEQEITIGNKMDIVCPQGENATHVYDGQPFAPNAELVNASVHDETTFKIEYKPEGSDIWYSEAPSLTDVGSKKVQVRVAHESSYYEPKTCEYTFSVTPRPVTLTSNTHTWTYDGKLHKDTVVKVTSGSFVEDQGFTYNVTASIQNAGTANNTFTYALNENTDPANYIITTKLGKLTVNKRSVTITSADSTRRYIEGEALIRHEAKVTSTMGFVNGDTVDYVFTGTQTYPGWSNNTFTIGTFKQGDENSSMNNYKITCVPGKLMVTENKELIIASLTDTVKFDGKHHTDTIFQAIIYGNLLTPDPNDPTIFYFVDNNNEYNTLYITPTADIVNVGETQATFTYKIVNDVTKNENTSCYETVTIIDTGKVVVIPVPLKIIVDDSKVYDKTKLATNYNKTAAVTAVGLVEDDVLTAGVVTTHEDTVGVYTYVGSDAHPEYSGTPVSEITTPFATKLLISNYNVSYDFNQEITKSSNLVVNCPSGSTITRYYNGTPLHPKATASGYEGDEFKIEYSKDNVTWSITEPSITHVAESPLTVYVRATNNNYDTATCNYKLTIKPRPITLTSATDQKEYDKKPLTNDNVTVTSSYTWIGSEGAIFNVTGTITEVGSTTNDFSILSWKEGTQAMDYAVSYKPGILTIIPSDVIQIVCPSGTSITKVYDGTAITPAPIATCSGQYENDLITIEYSVDNGTTWSTTAPTITHVAESKTVRVRANNINYTTKTCEYYLSVTPRPIKITADTNSKAYDGTALVDDGWKDHAPVPAIGDSVVSVTVTGSQTEVGHSDNVASDAVILHVDNNEDALGDYTITYVPGLLTVTPNTTGITVASATKEWMYDGSLHTEEVYTVTYGDETLVADATGKVFTLPTGDKITITPTAEGVEYYSEDYDKNNTFTYVLEHNDMYTGKRDTTFGTLSIIKRPVTIIADDAEKNYDGTPLTKDSWTLDSSKPLATGDAVESVVITGSQTEVGSSDNVPSDAVIMQGTTKDVTDCYLISYVNGKLTVYPKLEIVSVDVTNVTCKDANDGKVTINVQGGKPVTPKYSYAITGPVILNGTADDEILLTDLKPGEYNVKITDALDSTAETTFTVTEPELLVAVITVPTEATDLCPNQGSYPVSVTVTGGTEDYTYAWGGDATDVNAAASTVAQQGTKDCDNEYKVSIEVTDAHACKATANASFTVADKVAPTFTTPKDTTICRDNKGEIVKDIAITGTVDDAADNCTSKTDLTIEFEDQLVSGDPTTNMVYDRKWTVTDKCGNATAKTQEITIRPSILTPGNYDFTCPQSVEVILPYGDCEMWVNIGYPEFMNHMTGMDVEITNDAPAGDIFPQGENIVTWTATDECGAYIECQQIIIVKFPECPDAVDYEGNVYHGVRIGCDCWTQRNLESNKYSDGTDIPGIYNYESPDYPNVDENVEIFGRLYDWDSAIKDEQDNGYGHVQGICPEGWYLPTAEKYEALNLHGADALKSPDYWIDGGGSNSTDFTALPAGYYNGTVDRYLNLLGEAHFWSTTKVGDTFAPRSFVIGYECNDVTATDAHSGLGYSVRCIKEKE